MKNARDSNQVRIIAGLMRGRKIHFSAGGDIRPTPDRVRETLFNWLSPVIKQSRCLDLFCGSGSLGMEALSRGAEYVVFVDKEQKIMNTLQQHVKQFSVDVTSVSLQCCDAIHYLQHKQVTPFSIVFLDPPYHQGLLAKCMAYLNDNNLTTTQTRIYMETARNENLPELPENWTLLKQKTAGQVAYYLAEVSSK